MNTLMAMCTNTRTIIPATRGTNTRMPIRYWKRMSTRTDRMSSSHTSTSTPTRSC
jgi:hypothetical protein